MRILIADADGRFLETLQTYLRRKDHVVEAASDGLECSSAIRDFLPEVLVLDVELLWAEGVTTEMGKDRLLDGIPVILLSDVDPQVSRFEISGLRFADWVAKPFSLNDLLERIEFTVRNSISSSECVGDGGIHHPENGQALDFQSHCK